MMMKNERVPKKGRPQSVALRRNLENLNLDLSNVNQTFNGNWGPPRYGIEDEFQSQLDAGNYLVFKYTDHHAQSLFGCSSCDFEIDISLVLTRLDDVHCFVPKNMLCPVCDGKLVLDDTKVAQNSSPKKRNSEPEKGYDPCESSCNNASNISIEKGVEGPK